MIQYKTLKFSGRKNDPKFIRFLNQQGLDNWELMSAVEKEEYASSRDVLGVAYPNRCYPIVECHFKRSV